MIENIIKENGETEKFSEEKLFNSVARAGGGKDLAEEAVRRIVEKSASDIKASDVSREVESFLKHENRKIALRYNLKKAVRKLGPTGFPFEKYIAEIFSSLGFKSKTNLFLSGKCCGGYEIDFTAEKDNSTYIGECKYRNLISGKVQIDTALANYARFLDIKTGGFLKKENIRSILVTNSKFTSRAIGYSECVGVELLGWRYPSDRGLEFLIERYKLYPITILPSLSKHNTEILIQGGIMTARDLFERDIPGIPRNDLRKSIQEAQLLLND